MNSLRRRFLRQQASFHPRLERLESRDCPSCTVFQREGTLFVLGDEAANRIEIADTREGEIVVTCDGGEPQRFAGVTEIVVEAGAGDDDITATLSCPSDPGFHFRADLGAGDDRLSISGFDPQPDPPLRFPAFDILDNRPAFDIHAGAGDDTIAAEFSCPSDPSFHFRADLGAGNDRLDINWFDPQPDPPGRAVRFDIEAGEGDDAIGFNMGDVTINGQFVMNIAGGDGDDDWTMNLGDLMINGEFVVSTSGGAGNDDLIVQAILPCVSPEGRVRFGLLGDAGDDRLGVLVNGAGNERGSAQILGTMQLDLHGGGGDDRAILDIVTLDIHGAVLVNFDGDRGADRALLGVAADVRVFGLLGVNVAGGADDDIFDSFIVPCILPEGRGSFHFDGQAGADLIDVDLTGLESSGQLALQIQSGADSDKLLLGAIDPCFLPGSRTSIGLFGDAGDDSIQTAITGLEIGGWFSFDARGGIGNDHLAVGIQPCFLPESEARFALSGGADDDLIEVAMRGLENQGRFVLDADGGGGNDHLNVGMDPCWLPGSDARIGLFGDAGDDLIEMSLTGLENEGGRFAVEVAGGIGNDHLVLGAADPCWLPGSDTLIGLFGNAGDDLIEVSMVGLENSGRFVLDTDGGGGNDHLIVGIEPCILPESEARFALSGGADDDLIEVAMRGLENQRRFVLDVGGGGGNDHLIVGVEPCWLPGSDARIGLFGDAGDDLIELSLTGLENERGRFAVEVAGGIGNDHVVFGAIDPCWLPGSDTRIGLLGDAGDDLIEVSMVGLENSGRFVLEVVGGSGNDHLIVGLDPCILPEGEARISLLGGADDDLIEMSMKRAEIEGQLDLAILGGSGQDIIESFIQPCVLPAGRASFLFDGGEGADRIAARIEADADSRGALTARVFGGLGDDDLTLALHGVDDLALLIALVDGGRERDIARVTRNVRIANCEEVIFLDEPR